MIIFALLINSKLIKSNILKDGRNLFVSESCVYLFNLKDSHLNKVDEFAPYSYIE